MSSAIDPDSVKKAARPPAPKNPAATAGAKKPAAASPAGGSPPAPPAKPAPAATVPPPPKAAAKQPAPAKDSADARAAAGEEHETEVAPASSSFLKQTPAWAISMLVHIVALLGMALVVTDPPEQKKATQITAGVSESDTELNEFQDELDTPVTPVENVSAEDVVVTPEVAVTTVDVATNANDVEAAPATIEVTADFSNTAAVASNMMSTIGAVGGKGGGLGGRKSAGKLAVAGGGGKDTEEAVDRALKWIATHQMPDGGWSFDLAQCPSCQGKCSHGGTLGKDRCGATAMALLPFLGRGYTHREGPYKPQIERGITFMVQLAVKGQGGVHKAGGGSLYSQGLAGIAMSECYAMSQDGRLAAPTQAVLNYIAAAQDPVGGGWRYGPKQPGDTSAVGWQIMALKSGNMAYLQVNPLTIKKAVEFLDSTQDDDGAFYGYTGPGRGLGTTAVGLLCRMYLGWKKDHPALQRGVEFLAKRGPTGDLYSNYYSTQIMHHMEGEMWMAWNDKMKGMLLKTQSNNDHEAGSWYKGVEGGHGAHAAGRLYCTALATMILEVYYRHLPIYRNQVVDDEFQE